MKLIDRYVMREVSIFVLVGILGFTILIIGNNFYALSDLIFNKAVKARFSDLILISLLETPATMVLSLPVATLFGVILSIGRLAMDSELIAMRTGGISLTRIIIPLIAISLIFSVMTYLLDEFVVPAAGTMSRMIKEEKVKGQKFYLKNNVFFKRADDFILMVNKFNTVDKTLTRPVIYYKDQLGQINIYTAFQGKFEGDEVVLNEANHFIIDGQSKTIYEVTKESLLRLSFPEELQKVHDDKSEASSAAIGDLASQIQTLEQSGQDSAVLKTNLAFKYATPVACTIFSFVAFMFSVLNPRKERYSGIFMALVIIFIYYIMQTVFKSVGEKGLLNPYLSAWSTNIIFICAGIGAFIKTSK
jgi:lipopolysaccharide export system permease protein